MARSNYYVLSILRLGGFSGLLWYLYNPLNDIYSTVGGILSNGSAEGVAALGLATTAVPFVRAVSFVLIVSQTMSDGLTNGLSLILSDDIFRLTMLLSCHCRHFAFFLLIIQPFCIISGIFTIAACRTNIFNVILLLGLTFFFALIIASNYHIGTGDLARANTEQHVGGGFGIVSSLVSACLDAGYQFHRLSPRLMATASSSRPVCYLVDDSSCTRLCWLSTQHTGL